MRSIARFRAVVTSHARGLSGVPSRGQRSAAAAGFGLSGWPMTEAAAQAAVLAVVYLIFNEGYGLPLIHI